MEPRISSGCVAYLAPEWTLCLPYFFVLQVFTSVALFNMLISPLNAFPWVLNGLMEAWVSVKRLQAFLSLENLDLTGYYQQLDFSDKGESKSIVYVLT